jgi:tetratricopeptide (TPR) repeat protein
MPKSNSTIKILQTAELFLPNEFVTELSDFLEKDDLKAATTWCSNHLKNLSPTADDRYKTSSLLCIRGLIFLTTNRNAAALKDFNTAIENAATHQLSLRMLAICYSYRNIYYWEADDLVNAIKDLKSALTFCPDSDYQHVEINLKKMLKKYLCQTAILPLLEECPPTVAQFIISALKEDSAIYAEICLAERELFTFFSQIIQHGGDQFYSTIDRYANLVENAKKYELSDEALEIINENYYSNSKGVYRPIEELTESLKTCTIHERPVMLCRRGQYHAHIYSNDQALADFSEALTYLELKSLTKYICHRARGSINLDRSNYAAASIDFRAAMKLSTFSDSRLDETFVGLVQSELFNQFDAAKYQQLNREYNEYLFTGTREELFFRAIQHSMEQFSLDVILILFQHTTPLDFRNDVRELLINGLTEKLNQATNNSLLATLNSFFKTNYRSYEKRIAICQFGIALLSNDVPEFTSELERNHYMLTQANKLNLKPEFMRLLMNKLLVNKPAAEPLPNNSFNRPTLPKRNISSNQDVQASSSEEVSIMLTIRPAR